MNTIDAGTAKATPQISWFAVTFSSFKVKGPSCPSHSNRIPLLAKMSDMVSDVHFNIRKRGSINGKEVSILLRKFKEAFPTGN